MAEPGDHTLNVQQEASLTGTLFSLGLAPWISPVHKVDHPDHPQRDEDHSEYADNSVPLFNKYRSMAEREDNKVAKRWQKDAEGILIFVSSQLNLHIPPPLNNI
jgi:hypothetical protein